MWEWSGVCNLKFEEIIAQVVCLVIFLAGQIYSLARHGGDTLLLSLIVEEANGYRKFESLNHFTIDFVHDDMKNKRAKI